MRIVYFVTSEREALPARDFGAETRIVNVLCADWDRELSPWRAEKMFKGGEDFSGGADDFLDKLLTETMPAAEAGLDVSARYIAGYSLAGLFAVYAAIKSGAFDGFASMSGSLWFDGFLNYMKGQPLPERLKTAYFSLGINEKRTKNPRMRTVEECTLSAAEYLKSMGIRTEFILQPGGHFDNTDVRIASGIKTLLEQEN